MSKKLDVTGVVNELRDGSAFFPSRKPEAKSAHDAPLPIGDPDSPDRRMPNEPTNVSTNEQPMKRSFERKKIRHTFDIYHDQLLSLREMALKRELVFGERTLLGEVVQESLDMLITKELTKE